MTRDALATVVRRSINDAAFRAQLAADAPSALRKYDLTTEEFAAIRNRDAARLTALGVEQRMSKVFAIDPGAAGGVSVGVQSPDAADRNAATISSASRQDGAVQSPDGIDRNLIELHDSDGTLIPGAAYSGDGSEQQP